MPTDEPDAGDLPETAVPGSPDAPDQSDTAVPGPDQSAATAPIDEPGAPDHKPIEATGLETSDTTAPGSSEPGPAHGSADSPESGPRIADSVRLALPAEAGQIASLQRRAWESDLPRELAQPLLAVPLQQSTQLWQQAINTPPLARCRVLVAVDGGTARIAGFATTGPSEDPDADPAMHGELGEFVIDPVSRGHGHGSRLLNAVVDTLLADGCRIARVWIRSADDVMRTFLTETGWGADGAHRELGSDLSPVRLKQVRLHTAIG
ncbi:GNAT family N-acetyltransferase [Naumannella halotolerans]|uniref:GNAT family N-acetyltransferase n=1 Tax=Naumannella halotolerans TaxID=993414 RepID=UPI00370D55E2